MVDSMLRSFFNSSLSGFFERKRPYPFLFTIALISSASGFLSALTQGALELSFADGVVFKDLRIRPNGLNEQLEVLRDNSFASLMETTTSCNFG